jgi:hypothetical protein
LNQGSAIDLIMDCIDVVAKARGVINGLKNSGNFAFLPLFEPLHCKNLAFRLCESMNIFLGSTCQAFQAHNVNFILVLTFLDSHRFDPKPMKQFVICDSCEPFQIRSVKLLMYSRPFSAHEVPHSGPR